jgi:hypothetical protein
MEVIVGWLWAWLSLSEGGNTFPVLWLGDMWNSSPFVLSGLFSKSPVDFILVDLLLGGKDIRSVSDVGTIGIEIGWVLGINDNWSVVWSGSFSPGIGSFLSINGGLYVGFSVGMGFLDGIRKNTVIENVTIWVSFSLYSS